VTIEHLARQAGAGTRPVPRCGAGHGGTGKRVYRGRYLPVAVIGFTGSGAARV